jgi:lysophospholipase L1-like esterase
LVQDFAAKYPEQVQYVDYGEAFLAQRPSNAWLANGTAPQKMEINEAYMPDALHPSAAGMRIIAEKLEPLVSRLLGEAEGALSSS